jgi:uncharacterized HAD superfamily protein
MHDKWAEAQDEKVAGIDIDGVLNYYPQPWVDFINKWLDTDFKDLNEVKANVPYQKYRDIKYEYRESGVKQKLKVRAGARELLQALKDRGYTNLILTSRPFNKHKTLFKQTTEWLRLGKLPYDGIIFGENKYQEILQKVPNLAFMIEDHRYYANMIAKWGYPVFLVDSPYNQGELVHGPGEVIRIKELSEVLTYDFV